MPKSPQPPVSRRRILQLGVGAAAAVSPLGARVAAASTTSAPELAEPLAAGSRTRTTFGRLFPKLPAFAAPSTALTNALTDMGRPGGLLDAKDDLAKGPIQLILDPQLSLNNRDSSTHTAGVTFLGQFLDHDLTFDVASRLGVPTEPRTVRNGRTPAFDLDSVYGGGPQVSSSLYDKADRAKFKVESGGLFEDLPRASDRTAIIADPRNDENLMLAGLHCAMLLFHNRAVDHVRHAKRPPDQVFSAAQQLTRWHYQWIIVHEFLPLIVGRDVVDSAFARLRSAEGRPAAIIPVEFQGAAYRFGHSMVRPSYRANMAGDKGAPFFGFIFDTAAPSADPDSLVGGARAPRRFVGWQTFFDFGDGNVRPNKRIDTRLSTPLFHLPLFAIPTRDQPTALPQRTLLRHVTWSLPSGQAIAAALQVPPLASADLDELARYGIGLERSTPLFYYVLKEAELVTDGLRLGPVGARIVADVFGTLLLADPSSYLRVNPRWRPTLPTRGGNVTRDFRMVDFLTFARVDPSSRGQ